MKLYIKVFAIVVAVFIAAFGCSRQVKQEPVPVPRRPSAQAPIPTPLSPDKEAKLVRQGVLPPREPDGSVQSQVAELVTAVDRYELDVGSYPKTLDSLFGADGSAGWAGPYAKSKELLKDDKGNIVQYENQGFEYMLRFPGSDGKYGTTDDITSR